MHQPIEMNPTTLTTAQVTPACTLSRPTEPSSPARGEGLGGAGNRTTPARCRVDHIYARFNPVAVRATQRLHMAAELKCHRRPIFLALGASLALLAGCAVGPNYSRPSVVSPTAWKEGSVATNAAVLSPNWWSIFNEAELDSLESHAIEANQDLKQAVARVGEARALARLSEADVYPQVFASGGNTVNRASENAAHAPVRDLEYKDFYRQIELSYEIDAWGRVRCSIEAGKADLAATETDMQVVLLTLTSDVARNYFLVRSLDREKEVVQATIALRRDTVQLQETRNQAGLINEVDVTRARTELANVEAELHSITRGRAQVEHALAILCGKAPAEFAVPAAPKNLLPPEIPAGLPSTLLERRPDVVEAEHHLHAECARIGVAQAAFFPTIKLTGYGGGATADLGTLFNWQSRMWSLGPSIHFPIFEGGRNQANLKAAQARYEQSIASYRGTVLNAFREVEDSLSDLSTLTAQGEAVNRALVSARDTATLASQRYQQGLTSYLDVVDAQRAALQAERTEVQLHGQRAISTILLAKALGGGWERP
jgi:outer membrane protein, multidrug efflux system